MYYLLVLFGWKNSGFVLLFVTKLIADPFIFCKVLGRNDKTENYNKTKF